MPSESNFQLFGLVHWVTLGIIMAVAFVFIVMARSQRYQPWAKRMGWILAIALVGNELIFLIIGIKLNIWSYKWGLPLHMCDLAIFAVAYSLVRHNQFVWEIAYFWGLAGTVQAILTPDLSVTFPDYTYIKFFLTHGSIVVGALFLAVGFRRPIYFSSVRRVWWATNIYALFIGVFNWLLGTNYLYLCTKPSQPSVLDYLGPWPFYIVSLEAVLTVSLFVYYLPFYFVEKKVAFAATR